MKQPKRVVPKQPKRVVIEWSNGEQQIIGLSPECPPPVIQGARLTLSLVASKRAHYLYRPIPAAE